MRATIPPAMICAPKAHIVPKVYRAVRHIAAKLYRAPQGQIGQLTPRDMFAERKHEILPRHGSTICFLSQARYAAHAARREVEVALPYNAAGGCDPPLRVRWQECCVPKALLVQRRVARGSRGRSLPPDVGKVARLAEPDEKFKSKILRQENPPERSRREHIARRRRISHPEGIYHVPHLRNISLRRRRRRMRSTHRKADRFSRMNCTGA